MKVMKLTKKWWCKCRSRIGGDKQEAAESNSNWLCGTKQGLKEGQVNREKG